MYRYEPIEGPPLAELAECLNLAFSDYYLPVRLNESALAGICKASRVDEKLSFAAFQGEQMVGALLHSRGIYRGKTVLFDVAAGVIPEHRGKRSLQTSFHLQSRKPDVRAWRPAVWRCCSKMKRQLHCIRRSAFRFAGSLLCCGWMISARPLRLRRLWNLQIMNHSLFREKPVATIRFLPMNIRMMLSGIIRNYMEWHL